MLWYAVELMASVVNVRRMMIEEERVRRLLIRKTRKRRRQNLQSSPSQPAATWKTPERDTLLPDSNPLSTEPKPAPLPLTITRHRGGRLRGEVPLTATAAAAAAMITATASVATPVPSPSHTSSSGDSSPEEKNEKKVLDGSGGESENIGEAKEAVLALTVPQDLASTKETASSKPAQAAESATTQGASSLSRAAQEDTGLLTSTYVSLLRSTPVRSAESQLSASPPAAERSRQARITSTEEYLHQSPRTKNVRNLARAVRISFLLQSWVRLWLTMLGFLVVVTVFTSLLFLRLLGVASRYLTTFVVASPVLVSLFFLGLHSFVMMDGNGGWGGGAAIRGGGTRSALALGRRPIIFLAFVGATLFVLKIDGNERIVKDGAFRVLEGWTESTPWMFLLGPLWLTFLLIEGVFLRALLENWTGKSLVSTVFGCGRGGNWGSCLLVFFIGMGEACKCTGENHEEPLLSYPTSIRRRAVLTPSQHAAAAYLVGGTLCVTLAVLAVGARYEWKYASDWSVPFIMATAAVGICFIGMGLWQLSVAHCREMKGPLPPPARPLPIRYSEQEGGWTVGPADPPTVSIFLLGEVTLRQEDCTGNDSGDLERYGRWRFD